MADQMVPLRLHALGPPEVRLGDKLLSFPTRKTLALLIYLAIEAEFQPREHLATLLWPESSPERSYASLRNTLGRLQTALRQASDQSPSPYLSITHSALGLNPDAEIDLDLDIIEQAYAWYAPTVRAGRSRRVRLTCLYYKRLFPASAAIFWSAFHWAMPPASTIGRPSSAKSGAAAWA